ncbi:MAG: endonuclease III [Syntrophobacteraceae bacterium]
MGNIHINLGKVKSILKILDEMYPNPKCSLNFDNPLQLLVATILSAQCTDERVNSVTPSLFAKYPSVQAYCEAVPEELEQLIRSTGFYHNKAIAIKESSKVIAARFGGEVPQQMEMLVALPGVGRKTANVILGNAFGIPGIAVDTHVSRVSARLGLTCQKDRDKIEQDLNALVDKSGWVKFSHQLIQHGRKICAAKKPRCSLCPLRAQCDYGMNPDTVKA